MSMSEAMPPKTSSVPLRIDDRLGGFERAAAREDRQSPKERLLVRGEQIVAPGNGVTHRLLACRRVRAPPVSSGNRCSSRFSRACGGSILTNAAANSMASGRPSRREQISATAGALALVTAKSGLTACARVDKEAHRLVLAQRFDDGRWAGSGRGNGGSGYSRSP